MFSPRPISADGWITVPGRYENGRAVDLLTGKSESGRIHRYLIGPDMRWRKYTSNVAQLRSPVLLRELAASWCRGENRGVRPGRRLSTLEIRWWWRPVGADGRPLGRYTPIVLWRHWCQPKPDPTRAVVTGPQPTAMAAAPAPTAGPTAPRETAHTRA